MKKTILLSIIILASTFETSAQKQAQVLIDSLLDELSKARKDSNQVNTLNSLSKEMKNKGEYDTAKQYAKEALSLSQKIKFNKGVPMAYNNFGIACEEQGNYDEALQNHLAALKIAQEIGDKTNIAQSYNGIGNVYNDQGNYPGALKNYFVALKIWNDLGFKKGVAACYNNIGIIYEMQGNYPEALKNHFASLKIKEEIGYKKGMAASYNNIGTIYHKQGNLSEALKNFIASMQLEEEKARVADSYHNIGNIYKEQGNYSEALKNYFAALKISKESGYRRGMAQSYIVIGNLYTIQNNYPGALENLLAALKLTGETGDKKLMVSCLHSLGTISMRQKKYTDAKKYLDKAVSLSKELGEKNLQHESYYISSQLDSATGNWKDAYLHHKLYVVYRDSSLNEENTKKTVKIQMQYEFDKIQDSTKAVQDKKNVIAQEETKQQRNIRNFTFAGLTGVLIFLMVVYRQRNKISKEKKRSDVLLLNILPAETAEELKNTGTTKAKDFEEVTVLFTDFKNFTGMSEQFAAQELVNEINYCYSAFDNIITKFGIEKIKTIGDSYMCAGGLPVPNKTNAEDTVRAALAIRDFMLKEKQKREAEGKKFFEIRLGLHTGPVVAGIVGIKKYSYDIWGDTVNIASRMESSGEAGEVNISGSTYQLIKDKFTCTHRGKIEAKNKGMIDMYFVKG